MRSVPGRAGKSQFVLFDYRDVPLKIKRIITSSGGLSAVVVKNPSSYLPGWRYRIEARLAASPRPPGQYMEQVVIHTSDRARQTIVVPTLIERVRRVRVIPETLSLNVKSHPSESEVGRVYLDDTEGEALEVGSVKASHPALECTVRQASGSAAVLLIRVKGPVSALGNAPHTIRVALRRPAAEEICVTAKLPGG
jgi:hypothetical protein